MNTTQPLNKILFLLDDISQSKNRISISTHITRDIEIALLQTKIVELYGEIQQYNHQANQPAATKTFTNNYQSAPAKEIYEAPKTQTSSISETPKQAEKISVNPVQETISTPVSKLKEPTDFEKKREKLLREEQETEKQKPAEQQLWQAKTVENKPIEQIQPKQEIQEAEKLNVPEPVEEIKPHPEEEKPAELKPEPIPQPKIQTEQPTENVQPEAQQLKPQDVLNEEPKPQQVPEPAKANVSQLYSQAKDRADSGTGNSLNERLAAQQKQTSLNDKFQTNVKKNLADKLKLSPISDLRTAININQRVAFINQLFKGDDKEFKNVVSTVNGFKNFSEAKFYIQSDVSPRFSWNEQDEIVQEFMELVYRKFL